MNFYSDVFLPLCVEAGKSPSKVAMELGCSKSMVSNWKNRGTWPTDATMIKIENYFGIRIDMETWLAEKNIPLRSGIDDDDLMFALWGGNAIDMDAADLADVKAYADFLRQKKQMTGK